MRRFTPPADRCVASVVVAAAPANEAGRARAARELRGGARWRKTRGVSLEVGGQCSAATVTQPLDARLSGRRLRQGDHGRAVDVIGTLVEVRRDRRGAIGDRDAEAQLVAVEAKRGDPKPVRVTCATLSGGGVDLGASAQLA